MLTSGSRKAPFFHNQVALSSGFLAGVDRSSPTRETEMIETLGLLADVTTLTEDSASDRPTGVIEVHECDACGVDSPDVGLYAEDSGSDSQLWFCLGCDEW
jgi:hypothetical protein